MYNGKPADLSDKLARIISIIFHPLLMPIYGLVIIFMAPTIYSFVPFQVKKLVILIVLVNNVLVPLSLVPFFVHNNLISSWFVSERKERNILFIIGTILYVVTTYIIFRFPVPNFLKSFFFAVAFLSLTATMINLWRKISLYSIGAGAIIALVLILSIKMDTLLLWYLIPAIMAGGLILSARLQLGLHNTCQVWSGFLTGFIVFSLMLMIFQQLT